MKAWGRVQSSVVALISLVGVGVVVAPQLASAASTSGVIMVKGPGSAYAVMGTTATLAVAAGATATFSLKIVNQDSTPAQFLVRTPGGGADQPVALRPKVRVYAGALDITPAVYSVGYVANDGYFTNLLPAGGSQVLTVKVTLPAGVGQDYYSGWLEADLFSTSGTYLGWSYTDTEVKAPAKGTTAFDLFAAATGQPAVGGSFDYQMTTAAALAPLGVAKFSVKLMNDSAAKTTIGFRIVDDEAWNGCHLYWPATVKDGSVDITASSQVGSYRTPLLSPGASRTLTVSVTYHSGAVCPSKYYTVYSVIPSTGAPGHFSYLQASSQR